MFKLNLFFKFSITFLAALIVAFLIHIAILNVMELPKYDNLIIEAYLFNLVLGTCIFFGLYQLRIKMKDQIGFLFIGGSLLKFVLFFIVFYPTFKADGDLGTLEFSSFFVPYIICLLMETIFTAQMLQKQEK